MAHSVKLTWTAPTVGPTPTAYDVQRALVTAGVTGAFAPIANPEPTSTTYTDFGPFVEGNTYEYQVLSVDAAGESTPCPAVTVVIPFSLQPPSNLVAVAS